MNYLNIEGLDMLWERIKAGILGVRELARKNEQRLDSVEGTTNEANQRSKDNTSRLDSVEGIANATKALADVHTTRLDSVEGIANATKALADVHTTRLDSVESVGNEANTRSQDNTKRLDIVEGVANGAQALANNHIELINKVEGTAGTALQTAQLAQNMANEALDKCGSIDASIFRLSEDGELWLKSDISLGGTAEQPEMESVRDTFNLHWENIGTAKDNAQAALTAANEAKTKINNKTMRLSSKTALNDFTKENDGMYLLDIVMSNGNRYYYLFTQFTQTSEVQADGASYVQSTTYQYLFDGYSAITRSKTNDGDWREWKSGTSALEAKIQTLETKIEALEAKANTNN